MIFTKNFILLTLSNLVSIVGFMLLMPILPLFAMHEINLSEGRVGLVVSAFAFAAFIVRPIIGYTVDNYNPKKIILWSMAFFCASFFAYNFISTLFIMIIVRMVHGSSWATVSTAAPTMITGILPKNKRGEGLGYFSMSMPLAMVVGPALGLQLYEHFHSFKLIFTSCTVMAILGLLLLLPLDFPHTEAEKKPFVANPAALYETRSLGISFMQFCYSFAYAGLNTFLPLFAYKYHVGSAGFYFFIYALGVVTSRVMVKRTFDLKGPDILIIVGYILFAVSFVLLAFTKSSFVLYLGGIIAGMGSGMIMPTISTMNMNVVPMQSRGKANATLFTAIDLGIGSGAFLIGHLIQYSSYRTTYLISALIVMIPIFWFKLFEKPRYYTYIKSEELINGG